MTREEAVRELNNEWDYFLRITNTTNVEKEIKENSEFKLMYEAHNMAIQALEQEPCEDAISRKEVIDELNRLGRNAFKDDTDYDNFFAFVDSLPSVIPQEPKTGHWILADEQNKEDVENDNYRFICSECRCSDVHAKGTKVPYCWSCGAKMESEE